MSEHNKQLSKQISYILRHAPWEYELEFDEEGWVPLEHLLEGLNADGGGVTRADIEEMMRTAIKSRFEIQGDSIRAFYGHSVPGKLKKIPIEPPEILYHGTVERFLPLIRDSGLKPMSRQYVHLSFDPKTAEIVAKRRGKGIILLRVRARDAWNAGLKFHEEGDHIWLSDAIPAEWIEFE
ncbi:MAG: RNA 2'-phosphotransferase [Bacteroidota bacterium]